MKPKQTKDKHTANLKGLGNQKDIEMLKLIKRWLKGRKIPEAYKNAIRGFINEKLKELEL